MAFTLTIKTDSAAFGNSEYERISEIYKVLQRVAEKLARGEAELSHGTARDTDGNTVAEWIES